jgi:hypothetical protein
MKPTLARLKDADSGDLQIVKMDDDSGDVTWAVSLYGCDDFAWFLRKQDAEMFVNSFGQRAIMKAMSAP